MELRVVVPLPSSSLFLLYCNRGCLSDANLENSTLFCGEQSTFALVGPVFASLALLASIAAWASSPSTLATVYSPGDLWILGDHEGAYRHRQNRQLRLQHSSAPAARMNQFRIQLRVSGVALFLPLPGICPATPSLPP